MLERKNTKTSTFVVNYEEVLLLSQCITRGFVLIKALKLGENRGV
jgi:hypothetical protein